jgi:hypothetical protein
MAIETESNDTLSSSDELTADTQMEGQLSSSGDVDWFKYTTTGAASLNVAFDLPTNSSSDFE